MHTSLCMFFFFANNITCYLSYILDLGNDVTQKAHLSDFLI